MKVIWSPEAEADLVDAWTFIAADRRNTADAVEMRIVDAVESLGDFPRKGRPGKDPGTRELVVHRTPYIVIYRLRSEDLEIVRIWHGSREPFE
ncbi:type II toxin-antitoxin system RelE/ParE family toxin [Brevundimonas sp. PAMC22021]|uniref:type II toxin-antitoxin system RelE/ParE family toxin n=1 Tax=Brevundimonas sp. PAMC22021 TaxID=2861285 RepID=UPI001C631715|nr:type II toxin-antitoxin system RelE/ParE family toxin [Brevundimonas sp. PAMC22021]QYF87149.1 type II toxin-antitoxin system RelE/ParE family toxin [Brevundimonas sp. PAMC22021]